MAFTNKMRQFCLEYVKDFNATQAAIRAGYSKKTARTIAAQNLSKLSIKEYIDQLLQESAMSAEEAAWRMGRAARFDVTPYLIREGRMVGLDLQKLKDDGHGWYIKGLKYDSQGRPIYETWNSQQALTKIYDNVIPQQGDKDRPFVIKVVETND